MPVRTLGKREKKMGAYSTTLRTLPTATVLLSQRNVNLPSWANNLKGSMQATPFVISKRQIAIWSCLTKRGRFLKSFSPVFLSTMPMTTLSWTSTVEAWMCMMELKPGQMMDGHSKMMTWASKILPTWQLSFKSHRTKPLDISWNVLISIRFYMYNFHLTLKFDKISSQGKTRFICSVTIL